MSEPAKTETPLSFAEFLRAYEPIDPAIIGSVANSPDLCRLITNVVRDRKTGQAPFFGIGRTTTAVAAMLYGVRLGMRYIVYVSSCQESAGNICTYAWSLAQNLKPVLCGRTVGRSGWIRERDADCLIEGSGIHASFRGRSRIVDGTVVRPELVVIDDPFTRASRDSVAMTKRIQSNRDALHRHFDTVLEFYR